MYDFYGAGLPTLNPTLDDEYQRRLGAMEMVRLAQSQPPAAPPTPVVPPAAAVPAQGSQPFVDWPSYQQMRQGVDPAQAYREYVNGVLPNQLRAQGFSPEDVARGQAMFQNQILAPMPTPAQTQPQETTTKGLVSNAWDALVQEYGSLGRQAAAGKAVATGDTKRLAELAAEEGKEQPPAPVARFREAVGQPGSIGELLFNTAKAALQEKEGAFDSTLQMLAGFAPYIGAGMAGGAVGSVIPGVGSILGGAAAIGLTSADLEAGSKGLMLLRQAAARDGIDLNDATAVKNWIEKGGAQEVYGPAVKAGLTSGAVSMLAMGVAGKLGQRTEELLAQSNRVVPFTTEAAAGLRGQAKLAQAGEVAAGVGGFGAASALADLAAGQMPDEKDMFVNALTLLIPSLLHARGRFKEGVEAKPGEPPKPAAAKPEEVKPPEKKPDLTEEEIAGLAEEAPPKEEAKAEVKAAAPEETKPPPPTEAEVESVKPFPTKDDVPTVTALQLAQEAHSEALNEFFQQVGEEAKARTEERTAANPLATAVQPPPEEAAAAALQPSVATADVPLIRRGSFTAERTGEPAGNGPLLAGAGREAEAGPNRAEGVGVNEKSLYQGTPPEPQGGRPTRGAGRGRSKLAAEPRIPVSDERRNQPGGAGGNVLRVGRAETEAANAKARADVEEALRREAEGGVYGDLATKGRGPTEIGRYATPKEAVAAGHNPADYRPAGVHETMGPHFKPILWVNNKPYVRKLEPLGMERPGKNEVSIRLTPAEQEFMRSGDFADYLHDFMLDTGKKWHDEPKWDVVDGKLTARIDTGDAHLLREFMNYIADATEKRGELPPRMRDGRWIAELNRNLPEERGGLEPPSMIRNTEETLRDWYNQMTRDEEDLRRAQAKGDTKEEARIAERLDKAKRMLPDVKQLSENVNAGRWTRAIENLVHLGKIAPKDEELYKNVAQGATRSALENIRDKSPIIRYRDVARALLESRIVPRINFGDHPKETTWGTYHPETDEVFVDAGHFLQRPKARDELEYTLLHEIMHGGTVNAITRAMYFIEGVSKHGTEWMDEADRKYYRSEEFNAAYRLIKVFDWLKAQKPLSYEDAVPLFKDKGISLNVAGGGITRPREYSMHEWGSLGANKIDPASLKGELKDAWDALHREDLGFDPSKHYGATNPLELAAEVYNSSLLQEYLKKVSLPAELTGARPKNAWRWIVDSIKNLLGLKVENNALDEILALTSNVVRERGTERIGRLEYTPIINRVPETEQENVGRGLLYKKYGISNVAMEREAPKEHNAIVGVNKEGVRQSVSYRRDDGTYSHYYVTQEHKVGIPGGGTKGLTHEQLLAKLQEEGHKPLYVKNPNLAVEPRSTKKALGGYKDGQLVFAATPVKDAEGNPTGQWKITEGADLETKGSPRTSRIVEDYNDVIKARAEQKLGPTRRTSEAMAQATEVGERPEVNLVLPSKFNLTLANREAPSIYAGTQVARAGLEQGRPVPESMRPDIANTLKISKTEHDIERLKHERLDPLQKTGREIAKKWKIKSQEQIDRDIRDLVYDHRADVLLADDRYRDVPELETKVREQQAQAQQRLSQLPEGYKKELDAYLREWKKVSDELQDYKAKNELITQDQADAVKSRYELYIPMRTDLKSTQGKRATGASAESTHPLLRIINDWNKAIRENYQNRELQATYRMAEAHNLPLPDGRQLFELEPITQYRYDDEGNIQLGVKNLTLDPDSVVVKFEGKPYRMKINDPDYRDALKFVPPNDKLQAINASFRAMAMYNAISGGLKTAASPLFALKNLRDIQTAFGQTDERVSRKEIAKALASRDTWEPAIRNAIEPWTGTRGSKYSEDTRNAYISRRGMAGLESQIERPSLTLVPTPLQRAGELRKNWLSFEHGKISGLLTFFTKTGENLVRGAVFNAAMDSPKMWDSIGRANGTDGAAVKAAVDKYAAKQPLTPEEQTLVNHMHSEASSVAKNSTVNFEPKGRLSGPMNAMWIFANAKTQGARTYAERLGLTGIRGGENWRERLARGNPWTQGTTAVGTALGIASAMYLYKNDPDYPNMSDYQKDDYFTFGSGKFSLPLAPEMFWGYILGQSLVDAQMNPRWADPDMRKAKAATRFGTGILQTFWPAGSSMSDPVGSSQGTTSQYWQRMIIPTAIQESVVAPSANVNTFGTQIVPGLNDKGVPQSGKPLYAHNAEKVSPLAANLASGLHKAGVMDVAPQMLQYHINQLVKSQVDLAHTVAPQWDFFNSIFGEPPKEPGGEERPNSFERTFFQQASPLATKNDLEEIKQREVTKAFDRGEDPKKNPLVKMLQKGEDDSSKVFKGFGKMTPEQQKRATDRANEIRRNTLERYRQTQPQE